MVRKDHNPFKSAILVDDLYKYLLSSEWFGAYGITVPKVLSNKHIESSMKIINDHYCTISAKNHSLYHPMTMSVNSPYPNLVDKYESFNRYENNYTDQLLYKIFDGMRPSLSLELQFHDHSKHFVNKMQVVCAMNQFMKELYSIIGKIMIGYMDKMYDLNKSKIDLQMYKIHPNDCMFQISYYPYYNIPFQVLWNSYYSDVFTVVVSPILNKVGIIGFYRHINPNHSITIKKLEEPDIVVAPTDQMVKLYYADSITRVTMYQKMLSYDGTDEDCANKIDQVIQWYSEILGEQCTFINECDNVYETIGLYQHHHHNSSNTVSHVVEVTLGNIFNYMGVNVSVDGTYDTSFFFNESGTKLKRGSKIPSINILRKIIDSSEELQDGLNNVRSYSDSNNFDDIKSGYYKLLYESHSSFASNTVVPILEPILHQCMIDCHDKDKCLSLSHDLPIHLKCYIDTNSISRVRSLVLNLSIQYAKSIWHTDTIMQFKLHDYVAGSKMLTRAAAIRDTIKTICTMYKMYSEYVDVNQFSGYLYQHQDEIIKQVSGSDNDKNGSACRIYNSIIDYNASIYNLMSKPPVIARYKFESLKQVVSIFQQALTNVTNAMSAHLNDTSNNTVGSLVDAYHAYRSRMYIDNKDLNDSYQRYMSVTKERKNLIARNVYDRRVDQVNNLVIANMNKDMMIQFNYYCGSNVGYIDIY